MDPILLIIHAAADVPLKRRMEKAMGWGVIGTQKLPKESMAIDLFQIKKQHWTPGNGMGRNVFPTILHHIKLKFPLPSTRGYLFDVIERTEAWHRCNGKWICTGYVSRDNREDEKMWDYDERRFFIRNYLHYQHIISHEEEGRGCYWFMERFESRNDAFDLYPYLTCYIRESGVWAFSHF